MQIKLFIFSGFGVLMVNSYMIVCHSFMSLNAGLYTVDLCLVIIKYKILIGHSKLFTKNKKLILRRKCFLNDFYVSESGIYRS